MLKRGYDTGNVLVWNVHGFSLPLPPQPELLPGRYKLLYYLRTWQAVPIHGGSLVRVQYACSTLHWLSIDKLSSVRGGSFRSTEESVLLYSPFVRLLLKPFTFAYFRRDSPATVRTKE